VLNKYESGHKGAFWKKASRDSGDVYCDVCSLHRSSDTNPIILCDTKSCPRGRHLECWPERDADAIVTGAQAPTSH
jgi:hypothetical protein